MNCRSFCLSENAFVFSLFWSKASLDIEFSVESFVVSTLYNGIPLFLASMVSDKVSVITFIIVPMCVMCLLSLADFWICFLSLGLRNLIKICLYVSFIVYPAWEVFYLLGSVSWHFSQVWNLGDNYFFKYLFCPSHSLFSFFKLKLHIVTFPDIVKQTSTCATGILFVGLMLFLVL